MLVSLVAADDLVLKWQVISSNNTDPMPIVPEHFHEKILLNIMVTENKF